MNQQNANARNVFNAAADKVVNFDEVRERQFDLYFKNLSVKDQLFDAFINTPFNMWLFVRRGMREGMDLLLRRPEKDEGTFYYDRLDDRTLYMDRAKFESELFYKTRHGLGKKFQARAAALSLQAFDEARDFSVLVKTGQLKKFEI